MRLQGLRPESHAPTYSPTCASERDQFEILKHTAKGVDKKSFWGRGGNEKNKIKNRTIKPPSTLSVLYMLYMKIQGGHIPPLPPAADAHAYYHNCELSVDCGLRFKF